MPRALCPALIAFVLAGLSGCASARQVTSDPTGGVVAIPANTNSWPTYHRKEAEAIMAAKCPNGYEILREEEVVTGQVNHTDTLTKSQAPPTLLLAGAESTPGRGKQGSSSSTTAIALPVGQGQQSTQQTTSVRDITEWRITYRAK